MVQESIYSALAEASQQLAEEYELLDRSVRVLVNALFRSVVGTDNVGNGNGVPNFLV